MCGPRNAAETDGRSNIPRALFFIDRIKPRSFNMEMDRPIDYVTPHKVVSS